MWIEQVFRCSFANIQYKLVLVLALALLYIPIFQSIVLGEWRTIEIYCVNCEVKKFSSSFLCWELDQKNKQVKVRINNDRSGRKMKTKLEDRRCFRSADTNERQYRKKGYTKQDEKPIYRANGMCVWALHFSTASPRTILGLWQNLLNVIAISVFFCSDRFSIRFGSIFIYYSPPTFVFHVFHFHPFFSFRCISCVRCKNHNTIE